MAHDSTHPPTVLRILKFLAEHRFTKNLTTQELASLSGISYGSVKRYLSHPLLSPYRSVNSGRGVAVVWHAASLVAETTPEYVQEHVLVDGQQYDIREPVLLGFYARELMASQQPACQEVPQEPETPSEEIDEPHEDALLCSQATVRSLEAAVKKLRLALAKDRETARIVAGAVRPIPPVAVPWRKVHPERPTTSLLLAISDLHLGEVVRSAEMGGTNEYNLDIAREGLLDIIRRVMQWTDIQRHGYSIDHAQVLVLGDLIGGGIHPELAANAEVPAPVATAHAGSLLAEAIGLLSTGFGRVDVTCIAGNHDRLSHTTPFKRTNYDSLSHLAYVICRETLAKQCHIHIDLPEDPMPMLDVQGRRIVAMHGHQVKAGGNVPYYGIARRAAALTRERTNRDQKPPDHIILGHFHNFSMLSDQEVIIVPSMIGGTEWSRQLGFSGTPAQFACLVGEHGLHGMTCFERRTGRG